MEFMDFILYSADYYLYNVKHKQKKDKASPYPKSTIYPKGT